MKARKTILYIIVYDDGYKIHRKIGTEKSKVEDTYKYIFIIIRHSFFDDVAGNVALYC